VSFDDHADDDADDDASPSGPPPHPDDRLWRHPSEMAGRAGPPPAAPVTGVPAGPARPPAHRPWGLIAAAVGAAGAVVAGLAVGVAGVGDTEGPAADRSAPTTPTIPVPSVRDEPRLALARDLAAPTVVRLVPTPVVPARPPSTAGTGDVSRPSSAEVGAPAGEAGTGVLVRPEGIVVTSASLVGTGSVEADLADGRRVPGQVVGSDPVTGLALVDLDGDGYPVAKPASAAPDRGSQVVTVTAVPGGAEAAAGVVLGNRRVDDAGPAPLEGVVAVRAYEDADGLGAATVDTDGDLLGVTTAVGGGTSFAVPLDVVDKVTDDLLVGGQAHHGWLGIDGLDSSNGADGPAMGYGLLGGEDRGVVVSSVAPEGPSALAGLEQADVILALDGHDVRTMADLVRWLRARSPGDTVELTIERDGATSPVTVTVGRLPGA
jgi:S1-C subfamily serine protease